MSAWRSSPASVESIKRTAPGDRIAGPALLLCRTPFQAWLLLSIVPPDVVYDVVYVTRHDAPEDRHYFARLSARARQKVLIHEPKHERVLPHNLAILRRVPEWTRATRYATILVASIDSPAFRRLVARHPEAALATFDDGAESLLPDPFLMRAGQPWRDSFYGRLLGGGTVQDFRLRIARHFTLFGSMQNVVPNDRAVVITQDVPTARARDSGRTTTFFIGQPFTEVFSAAQIRRIQDFARSMRPDFYVCHPRENSPLLPGIPLLAKEGRIAEDAILRAAEGGKASIIAAFSTLLFTLPADMERIHMNVTDGPDAAYRARVAAAASCRCVDV